MTKLLWIFMVMVGLLVTGRLLWLTASPVPAPQEKGPSPASPNIPAPILQPALVAVNTPTVVAFTVAIGQPTLNPTTVELLRVSEAGGTSLLAAMEDKGKNGDERPGDKIFTALVTFREATIGRVRLKIQASFLGNANLVQSLEAILPVVPPDPGLPGEATVAGIDSDQNGIRDDVQRFIAVTYQDEGIFLATSDRAAADQSLLIAKDVAEAQAAMLKGLRATECLSYFVPNSEERSRILSQLKYAEINSEARLLAWLSAQDLAAGEVYRLSDSPETSCTFNVNEVTK